MDEEEAEMSFDFKVPPDDFNQTERKEGSSQKKNILSQKSMQDLMKDLHRHSELSRQEGNISVRNEDLSVIDDEMPI